MSTLNVFLFILLGWALIELFYGIYIWRRRQQYSKKLAEEKVRAHFAKTRQELMRMAIANQIDVNSYTFRVLYVIHTFILRRPDRYVVLSLLLGQTFFSKSSSAADSRLQTEAKLWNTETKNLVRDTGKGLAIVVEQFAPIRRYWDRIKARLFKILAETHLDLDRPQIRSISEITRAKETMFELATA